LLRCRHRAPPPHHCFPTRRSSDLGTVEHPAQKPVIGGPAKHRFLVTVKAAPNPSTTYGETVCVAGIRLGGTGPTNWVRLYPINFRHLPEATAKFKRSEEHTSEFQSRFDH